MDFDEVNRETRIEDLWSDDPPPAFEEVAKQAHEKVARLLSDLEEMGISAVVATHSYDPLSKREWSRFQTSAPNIIRVGLCHWLWLVTSGQKAPGRRPGDYK